MIVPQLSVTTGTAANAAASSNASQQAGTTGATSGTTNSGTATFGNTLIQVIGGNAASTTTTATPLPASALSLSALLQGLSPELLTALLGSGEQSADTSEIPDELLQLLAEKPELLDSLLDSDEFQNWLSQAAELLQGMQILPTLVASLDPKAVNNEAPEGQQAGLTTKAQAHTIISAFAMAAASEQKGSLLFQQLKEDFTKLLTPSTTVTTSSPQLTQQTVAAPEAAVQEMLTKMQGTVISGSALSKLEILAVKSGLVERFANARALKEPVDTVANNVTAASEEETVQHNVQFQDLLKLSSQPKAALTQSPVSSESFVSDMSRFVLSGFKTGALNGLSEARLSLTPETLGHVDVKIALQNGQLVAQFAAQTITGKEMIESQLAQLRAALQQQGIQVEKLEVVQQSSQLASSMFHDHRHQQPSSQQSSRQNNGNSYSEEGEDDFSTEIGQVTRNEAKPASEGIDVIA